MFCLKKLILLNIELYNLKFDINYSAILNIIA